MVLAFYKKATTDFLIGYHFRKIVEREIEHFEEGQKSVLSPPIEAFKSHLPRINNFWKMQLLDTPLPKEEKSFDLIKVHKELFIKKGELGRWVILFEETLHNTIDSHHKELKEKWLKKIHHFKERFLNHPTLF